MEHLGSHYAILLHDPLLRNAMIPAPEPSGVSKRADDDGKTLGQASTTAIIAEDYSLRNTDGLTQEELVERGAKPQRVCARSTNAIDGARIRTVETCGPVTCASRCTLC